MQHSIEIYAMHGSPDWSFSWLGASAPRLAMTSAMLGMTLKPVLCTDSGDAEIFDCIHHLFVILLRSRIPRVSFMRKLGAYARASLRVWLTKFVK